VTRLFVEDVHNRIRYGGYNADGVCDTALMDLLEEAHSLNIEIYGLFAASDAAFSEQYLVNNLNLFNQNCGTTTSYFDGASVNNEYFTRIKNCNGNMEAQQLQFLHDLEATAQNAAPLPLHFSTSWNWYCCDCGAGTERMLTYSNTTQNALTHMVDIVDSVDVQVAWNTGPVMQQRATNGYTHWQSTKLGTTNTTAFYVLAYTNPVGDCRLSFSPHTWGATALPLACATGDRTQQGLFDALDAVEGGLVHAQGGIHYFGGVFSSGMVGWPKH